MSNWKKMFTKDFYVNLISKNKQVKEDLTKKPTEEPVKKEPVSKPYIAKNVAPSRQSNLRNSQAVGHKNRSSVSNDMYDLTNPLNPMYIQDEFSRDLPTEEHHTKENFNWTVPNTSNDSSSHSDYGSSGSDYGSSGSDYGSSDSGSCDCGSSSCD